jgi:hypothetical protein
MIVQPRLSALIEPEMTATVVADADVQDRRQQRTEDGDGLVLRHLAHVVIACS